MSRPFLTARRPSALLYLSAAMALLLAACSPAAAPAPTAAPKPVATTVPAQPAAAPTTAPAAAKPAAAASAPAATTAPASASADFSGKTIRLVVGNNPGGGFDATARLLAPIFAKALPGNPTVVVENLTGADTLVAAKAVLTAPLRNNEYSIVVYLSTLPIKSILSGGLDGFSPEKESVYIGKPDAAPQQLSFCIHSSVVKNLDEFLALKQPVKMSGLTGGSYYDTMVRWTKEVGFPVEPVFGYQSTSNMLLAFNQGEVDAAPTCRDFDLAQNPDWLDKNEVTPLFYYSAPAETLKKAQAEGKYPWYKNVLDVKQVTPEQKAVLQTLNDLNTGTNVYAVSKQVPGPVVDTLRQVFKQVVDGDEFHKAMDSRQLAVGYQGPDDLDKAASEVANSSQSSKDLLKRMLGF